MKHYILLLVFEKFKKLVIQKLEMNEKIEM